MNTISGRDRNAYETIELVMAFGRYTATNSPCTTVIQFFCWTATSARRAYLKT